jgi:phytoene dehydrogenase-like protein
VSNDYDVIVIGAGLGGLSAATFLASEGLRVLLLERHNIPGGYATSFVRGRYEFEVALHELSGIGPPENRGGLYRYLDSLGVTKEVDFIHIPNLYRAIYPDLDITLKADRASFEQQLCQTFPHEADGIRRFVKRIFDLRGDLIKISIKGGSGSPLTLPLRLPHFFRYLPTSWGHVLNRDVKDPRARAVLSQYWGYVGMPPSKISFIYFATTLASYLRRGAAFPTGRSQALANAFIARLEAYGGVARMGCGVQRITLTPSNERINGVITDQGEEINADWVISNADPITTCRELIGANKVPTAFTTQLQSSEVAASTVNVYLGVAQSHEKLGLDDHEIFINSDYDFESQYQMMRSLDLPPAIALTCYNVIYPDISPPGTSIVVLTALSYAEPWYQIPPTEYVATKNRLADAMITLAEKVAPGLREYTEVVEVSTPLTNIRYAGTLGGSIYGFNQPPRDNPIWRMPHKGPLEGLYFVGAWTQPGGGFEPAIRSGRQAGWRILRKLGKLQKEA